MTYSGLVLLSGCLLLGFAFEDRGRARWLGVAAAAPLGAMLLTFTRNAYVGLLAGLVAYLAWRTPAGAALRAARPPRRLLAAARADPRPRPLDRRPLGREQPRSGGDGARGRADDRRLPALRPRARDGQALLPALPRPGRAALARAAPAQQHPADRGGQRPAGGRGVPGAGDRRDRPGRAAVAPGAPARGGGAALRGAPRFRRALRGRLLRVQLRRHRDRDGDPDRLGDPLLRRDGAGGASPPPIRMSRMFPRPVPAAAPPRPYTVSELLSEVGLELEDRLARRLGRRGDRPLRPARRARLLHAEGPGGDPERRDLLDRARARAVSAGAGPRGRGPRLARPLGAAGQVPAQGLDARAGRARERSSSPSSSSRRSSRPRGSSTGRASGRSRCCPARSRS